MKFHTKVDSNLVRLQWTAPSEPLSSTATGLGTVVTSRCVAWLQQSNASTKRLYTVHRRPIVEHLHVPAPLPMRSHWMAPRGRRPASNASACIQLSAVRRTAPAAALNRRFRWCWLRWGNTFNCKPRWTTRSC